MTILVPMDGSAASRKALDLTLSEYPAAEVIVLHVIDPPGNAQEAETDRSDRLG
ncbi:MAG: universal stress protein [Natrialbaceae archaeon]|nr:universal stress protein [Natrialbaceae archaeon]